LFGLALDHSVLKTHLDFPLQWAICNDGSGSLTLEHSFYSVLRHNMGHQYRNNV